MKFSFGILLATSLVFKTIEASVPNCSDCTVHATSDDGTAWGWENDAYCRIPSSCTKSTEMKKTTTTTTTPKKATTTKKTTTSKKSTTTISSSSSSSTPVAHEKDENGNLICNDCVSTGTGGDGSLWGWEDEKSCIIDQTKCQGKIESYKASTNATTEAAQTHEKDASGNLICNECNATSTGGDGSLWGWEDEASCIIDNAKCNLEAPKSEQKALERGPDGILICSTCEYTRIDSDTTTWNKENGEDCRVIGSRCGINTTPHPWCAGCVVTGTGNDGALYGWENEASCLINEVSCGIVDNHGQYGEASSSPATLKITSFYTIIASLAFLYYAL